jgi:sulfate adenylyltransferase large subunit
MELLRFVTAGSVDDGKSTLIGRLLYDSKEIFEDQLEAIERSSRHQGHDFMNLALVTDGLRAEREQGITIDVAYRYFATPRRKFIIADTPGHVQYTRNMVTGASTAQLALILVDARTGVIEQTRRHAYLTSLLGIRHLVLCVNKMDLVDYDRATFESIVDEFAGFARQLDGVTVTAIPMFALDGDNVVERSTHMPWYEGTPLLEFLETLEVHRASEQTTARFPVQSVIRPRREEYADYRGYAGSVAGGEIHPGDEVLVLPSGIRTTIEGIDVYERALDSARPPESVTLRLADDIDVTRGDMICAVEAPPEATTELAATVCWMAERSTLEPGSKFWLKHTTRRVRAVVDAVEYRVNVNTLDRDRTVEQLALNDIGRIRLRTTEPVFVDPYSRSRETGSFILIDPTTNVTVGAGMIADLAAEAGTGVRDGLGI